MITKEQLEALEDLIVWAWHELRDQEDHMGLTNTKIREGLALCEEVYNELEAGISSAGNRADQIGENPYCAIILDEAGEAFEELESKYRGMSWDIAALKRTLGKL